MRNLNKMLLAALFLAVITVGCNGSNEDVASTTDAAVPADSNAPDATASVDTTIPVVSSTNPGDSTTRVAINGSTVATFSEAMDPATCTAATFTLKQGTSPVQGTVTCIDKTATFTPFFDLAASTLYTATITTGVKDTAGDALLAADKVWSFTTGATKDTTGPIVSSTEPSDATIGVVLNQHVSATFNEAVDPATITEMTFTLKQGGASVAGTVTAAGSVASFIPANDLLMNAVYTATITTNATDLAGNSLVDTKVWSFTTGSTVAAGPAPVVLGTAGNFVILSKSGISTTGTTSVVGDMGVSPIDQTAVTGFSQTTDASNQFSTSAQVTGKIYAADYAPPTPSNMTTSVSDMEIAYTDAAGRSLPNATELGAGNISGMTIVPGLYKWSTGLMMDGTGVTLSGGANDVWIFQIAQTLTVANGAIVTLSGGAQAKNIFWQVAGQATLGTTSSFKGILLDQTAIVLQTGATMNGRALAQTAVTLDATAITAP